MDVEADKVLDLLSQYYTVTPLDAGEFSAISVSAPLAPDLDLAQSFARYYNTQDYVDHLISNPGISTAVFNMCLRHGITEPTSA